MKILKNTTFSVQIEKEVTRIDKSGEEITKIISQILQLTDSPRFMKTSLSSLANNLAEEIHKIKLKYKNDDKKIWNFLN